MAVFFKVSLNNFEHSDWSIQYLTRTGERNLTGLVKDGVNSASRYYLNHIRDSYRQAAIDVLIGKEIGEELLKSEKGEMDEVDNTNNAEHVKTVIEDCKKQITQVMMMMM